MRPLTLHASALNNDEYEEYTRALRELGEVPEGETDEEEWYEHITLGVREVRAWLRGRYSSLSVGVLDQILKFLSPTLAVGDVVNGGQFFAVLRLMTHVQNGREVDRGLAFVQAHPQTQSNQPSLSSSPTKISAPRPPPPRRKRSATFDSAQHAQPPQHPSHHNLGQGVSAGLKSLVSRAVPPPPIPSASGPVSIPIPPPRRNNNNDDDDNNNAGGLSTSPSKSTGPPLPPRKPTLPAFPPPPPVHSQRPRSVSPKKSVTALPGERAPPPPPPRPANLPPVPSSSKPQMVSRGSYTSTSAGIGAASTPMSVVPTPFHTQQQPAAGGGQHQTSELMKQSLQASKAAQSLKRHEAEKEKERVMQVLKSSSRASTSSTGNSPWKPPKPVPLPPMMSKERSRDRERSPARPPFPPKPLSTSSISSLSDDGRRLATRSFHAPAPSVGYAPSAVSSTSRVSRSSMEQVALAGSEASGGLGRVPPPVPPLPSSHSHYSQAGPAPPTSSSSSTSTTGVSGGVQGRAPPPPPPPAHPDRKPVLPPRDRSTSRPRVSPGTPTTPGGVQRRHTVNHHHHSQSPSHSRYTQQRRGDESRERERYARLGDDEEDEESGSVGSFDEVYKTPFEGPLTPFGGPATPTPFGGASTLGGDEQDNQATIRGHGGDARTERMKRRHSAHNPFYTSGDVGVDSTGGSGVGLGVSGAGGILGAAGAGSGGGERAGGGAVVGRSPFHSTSPSPFHSNTSSPLGSPSLAPGGTSGYFTRSYHSRSGSASPVVGAWSYAQGRDSQGGSGREDGEGEGEAQASPGGRVWRSHSLHQPRSKGGRVFDVDGEPVPALDRSHLVGRRDTEAEEEVLDGSSPFGRKKPRPQSMRALTSPREGVFAEQISAEPVFAGGAARVGEQRQAPPPVPTKRRSFQPPPQHYAHGQPPPPPIPPLCTPASGSSPSKAQNKKGAELGSGIGLGLPSTSGALSRHTSLSRRQTSAGSAGSGHRKSSLSVSSLPMGGGLVGSGVGNEKTRTRDWAMDPKYHQHHQHHQHHHQHTQRERQRHRSHERTRDPTTSVWDNETEERDTQPIFSRLEQAEHRSSATTDPLAKFASSTREKFERFEQRIQPKLEKARFKAEAGLSRRGFVPTTSSTAGGGVLAGASLKSPGASASAPPSASLDRDGTWANNGGGRRGLVRDDTGDSDNPYAQLEYDEPVHLGQVQDRYSSRKGGVGKSGVYSDDDDDSDLEYEHGRGRWKPPTTTIGRGGGGDGTSVDRPEEGWRALP